VSKRPHKPALVPPPAPRKDSIGTMKQGETLAMKQVAGQADIVDVVNAVNQAELTLNTVVAVRDKVIQAYQSIMQMPI